MDTVLDNPIWASLCSRHRALARGDDRSARYPPDVAPFLGVARAGADLGDALPTLVAPDETVYLLGQVPRVPDGWSLKAYAPLAQMICPDPLPASDAPPPLELGDVHRADVLALTALVYPHYFRPRTMELGRYFGLYLDGRLAAIIGERMGMDRLQEISAVCTHPDFHGRGFARHLVAWLSNDNLRRGRLPFLHVSHDNARAMQVYAQTGYQVRRDIGFWSLRRA